MGFFSKKKKDSFENMDLESVMKKFDRESNTRIWEGVPKIIVYLRYFLYFVFM